ncbi:GNAT family N-acetyltransferase [Streptomyces axinellae]|uniref:GNAT family N-acetyltransferase n=1 Tax=Streptomyces axinellae TaxID=552788 RepID=UPI0031DC8EB6
MTSAVDPLRRVETYLDAVPRVSGRAEDFGPLTLFVADEGAPFPYCARPAVVAPGRVAHPGPGPDDVWRVRERQRRLGVPESFEWIGEHAPGLRAAAGKAGLRVWERPLMVLDTAGADAHAAAPPGLGAEGPGLGTEVPGCGRSVPGAVVRVLGAGDPALPGALAVPYLAFAEAPPGGGRGSPLRLEDAVGLYVTPWTLARARDRVRAGHTVVAAALDDAGVPLCAGQLLPLGGTTELVGIGTLPAVRRRGLGAAVTAALVAEARRLGLTTVFLTANDERAAQLYARHGFRTAATACFAQPAPGGGAG